MNYKYRFNTARRSLMSTPILACSNSPTPENDWGLDSAVAAGYPIKDLSEIFPETNLQESFSWPIGDQKGEWSCVGWAVADSVLRWHLVHTKGINEQIAWRCLWMAAKETDEFRKRPTTFIEGVGTSIKAALS